MKRPARWSPNSWIGRPAEAAASPSLTLHSAERLATARGATISVVRNGVRIGSLSDRSPTLDVPDAGGPVFDFAFLSASGVDCGISWSQVHPGVPLDMTVAQPWREQPSAATPSHVLAWSVEQRSADLVASLDETEVTILSPIWWTIGKDGTLEVGSDATLAAALDGVALWPCVHGLSADGLHLALGDAGRRQELAVRIAGDARRCGAQGVNVDLEGYREQDGDAVADFTERLSGLVHAWGGVTSCDIVPRSDDWDITPKALSFWSTAPRRRRLAAACDFTVLMAYDQHNGHRPAGPVASPNWVEDVLAYQLRFSDPQRTILGIPAYGLLWRPDALTEPHALPLNRLRAGERPRLPDPVHGVDRVIRADFEFFWCEFDIAAERIALADRYGLAGIAVWQLGLDYPDLWKDVRRELTAP